MTCIDRCYFFADMSWYTHKIASLIFGTPPTSTFQEALEYFSNAEKSMLFSLLYECEFYFYCLVTAFSLFLKKIIQTRLWNQGIIDCKGTNYCGS